MTAGLLEARALTFAFEKHKPLFRDVNFSLGAGEVLVLLGPNGAGKTTLLNCLAGQLTPAAGEVLVAGRSVKDYSPLELARRLAYVAQLQNVTFSYAVGEYLLLGRAPYLKMTEMPGKKDQQKVKEVMRDLDIEHLAERDYSRLSGGERQQVQIARALIQESPIILLDEPANHLDYGNQYKVLYLIHNLAVAGYTILMTSHMPDTPLLLQSKVGIIGADGAFSVGQAAAMVEEKALSRLYGLQVELVYVPEIERKACFYKFGNR